MADISDIMGALGTGLTNRFNNATSLFTDPNAVTNRISQDLGVNANTRPTSTNIAYNDDGSASVTHKFDVAPVAPNQQQQYTMPQANYALNQPAFAPQPQQAAPVQPVAAPAQPIQQAPAQPIQQAPVAQQTYQGQAVPPSMSGIPATGAGMFPSGAQPIPTTAQQPSLTNAIAQVESGNNNAAVGAAGETGAMQVLPATLKNPGFGVRPAQDNTPEEANRVGKDYYNTMLTRYGNDPLMAAGAYNAGPGAMDRAIAKSKELGGNPLMYLPASTQKYVAQFGEVTKHMPGQPAEASAAKEPWKLEGGPGLRMPGQEFHAQVDELETAKGDPQKLNNIIYNPATTKPVQAAATDMLLDHLTNYRDTERAMQTINAAGSGDAQAANRVANVMKTNNPSTLDNAGNIMKAVLLRRLGFAQNAQDIMDRVVPRSTTSPLMLNGQHYAAQVDPNGNIVSAKDSQGNDVDNKTIAGLQANAVSLKGATTSATTGYDKDNNVINKIIVPGRPIQYYNATTGQMLDRAPAGYREGKDVQEQAAINKAGQTAAFMIKENEKSIGQGAGPRYTQEEINAAHQQAYEAAGGKGRAPATMSTAATGNESAGGTATASKYTPQVLAEIEQIAKGNKPAPTGPGAQNYFGRQVIQGLNELHPEYNQGDYKRILANKEAWDKGPQAKQVQQLDRASSHAVALDPVIDNLKNTNSPIWNKIKNEFEQQTGSTAPADFETAKQIVGDEVVKTVLGGTSAVADREGLQRMFNAANTGPQLKAVLNRAKELMGAQATAMERQYKYTTKQDDFNDKLGPAAQQILGQGHASDRAIAGKAVQMNLPDKSVVEAEMRKRGLIK